MFLWNKTLFEQLIQLWPDSYPRKLLSDKWTIIGPQLKNFFFRLLGYLETKQYEVVQRLMTQMEVDDRCYEMALMICDKKDAGQEELGLRYLNELEKQRSVIVERVFKFEEKNIATESRRMVEQLGRRDDNFKVFLNFSSKLYIDLRMNMLFILIIWKRTVSSWLSTWWMSMRRATRASATSSSHMSRTTSTTGSWKSAEKISTVLLKAHR